MKKVIVFGTFDILHPGHLDYFRQAKKKGDLVVAVVARDINVKKIKNKLPCNNEGARVEEIMTMKKFKKRFPEFWFTGAEELVGRVILGNKKNMTKNNKNEDYRYKILQIEKPDIICLGYDQKINEKELQNKLKEYKLNKVEVVRLKSFQPDIYKSSLLK